MGKPGGKGGGLAERMRLARLAEMQKEREKTNPLPPLVRGNIGFLSEENRRHIATIADRLAPYEEFANATGDRPEDQVALFEVLEDAKVINDDLVKMIRGIGRSMAADQAAREDRFFKYVPNPDAHPGTGEKIMKIDNEGFNTAVDRQNREMGAFIERVRHERRGLLMKFLEEIQCHSYIASIMTKIRRFKRMDASSGFAHALADTEVSGREGLDPPHQAAAVAWFRLAEDFSRTKKSIEKPKFVGDVSPETALQELKRVTFEETSRSGGWKVPLPGIRWRGADIICNVRVEKDQSSIVICKIGLEDIRGIHIADGHLSRITGDLAVTGTLTVSAGDVFAFFEEADKYRLLRDHVLAGIYKLWKEKDLKEEIDVVLFVGDEDEEGDDEEAQEDEQQQKTVSGALPQARRPTQAEMLRAFEEQHGPQREREKRGFVEEGELSGYSWRRVLEAFRRCGVTVVMEGDHPKLKHGGKTIDYINRHEPDPRRNRAVTNRVLRSLGIPKDLFRKNLY